MMNEQQSHNTFDMNAKNLEHIKDEILQLKKDMFDLRFKKATRQQVKPHLFKITKHRLAKLLTMQKQYFNQ